MNETNKWSIDGSVLKFSGSSTFLYSWNKALPSGWNSDKARTVARWMVDNQNKPHFPVLPDQLVKRWCNNGMNGSAFREFIEYIEAHYPLLVDVMLGNTTIEAHTGVNTKAVASIELDLANFQSAAKVYELLAQIKNIPGVKVSVTKG